MTVSHTDIIKMRPFIPAKDFERSKSFYRDLGFSITHDMQDLAELSLGEHNFLLQNYYRKEWAENCVMHLLVPDAAKWWRAISEKDLAGRHDIPAPEEPKMQPWGLKVMYLSDPSGVLWHIAEAPATT